MAYNVSGLACSARIIHSKVHYMEKLHSLIDDLELMVDKLPKEANWFGNVDHIRETIKDMRRALQQTPCKTLLPHRKCNDCGTEYYSEGRCPECFS